MTRSAFCKLPIAFLLCVSAFASYANTNPNPPATDTIVLDNLMPGDEHSGPLATCDQYQAISSKISTHQLETKFINVPLDWNQPEGEHLSVGYHILRPLGSVPSPEVIMYFNGGPGIPALYVLERFESEKIFRDEFAGRTFIIMDQRGTGGCSSHFTLLRSANKNESIARTRHYGSRAIIKDAEAIRQHEGIERWVIAGESNGSQLVHRYLTMVQDLATNPLIAAFADVDAINDRWQDRKVGELKGRLRLLMTSGIERTISSEIAPLVGTNECIGSYCGTDAIRLVGLLPVDYTRSLLARPATTPENKKDNLLADLRAAFGNVSSDTFAQSDRYCDPATDDVPLMMSDCYNEVVNSYDTLDNLSDVDFAQVCANLQDIPADYASAVTNPCPLFATSPEAANSTIDAQGSERGTKDVMSVDQVRDAAMKSGTPLHLTIGYNDSTSPPEIFARELVVLGYPYEEVLYYCMHQVDGPKKTWSSTLGSVMVDCTEGHGARRQIYQPNAVLGRWGICADSKFGTSFGYTWNFAQDGTGSFSKKGYVGPNCSAEPTAADVASYREQVAAELATSLSGQELETTLDDEIKMLLGLNLPIKYQPGHLVRDGQGYALDLQIESAQVEFVAVSVRGDYLWKTELCLPEDVAASGCVSGSGTVAHLRAESFTNDRVSVYPRIKTPEVQPVTPDPQP